MKLKNKKTGEVITLIDHIFDNYSSLDELTEDWEEVKPEGPLIKDEKIRKAVRTWAEANEITQVSHDACWNAFRCSDFVIAFDYDFDRHDGFEDMKSYTIDELCGEDEE